MSLDNLIYAVLLFLVSALVFTTLAQWLRLGLIVGYLAAGVAIGPYSPGPVLTDHVPELLEIAEVGVVLLMFTIGLEMQPQKLWALRRFLFGLGPAQVFATGALLSAVLWFATGFQFNTVIVLGFGFALSSTAVAMQILSEKGDTASQYGEASFGVLIAQDIAAVPLLVLVSTLAVVSPTTSGPSWQESVALFIAALAGVLLLGRYLLPRVLKYTARHQNTTVFGVVLLTSILVAALAMEKAGLSMAMGSFLLGVLLSNSDFRYQVEASILPLKSLFMAIFFVAVGMAINLQIALASWAALLFYVTIILLIKVACMTVLARVFGLDWTGSLRSALLISQCGEFGFVLFTASLSAGLLSERGYALSVVVVSLSMALTPFMVKLGERIAQKDSLSAAADSSLKQVSQSLEGHVVVAGYNRIGRLMCLMLEKSETPYIAFDMLQSSVEQGQKEGFDVYYGDVTNPYMQGAAALATARAVVLSLEDMERAEKLIDYLRTFYPNVPVLMAVQTLLDRDRMRSKGVQQVVCMPVEGGLQLGQEMLETAGAGASEVELLVEQLRNDDYALIRGNND